MELRVSSIFCVEMLSQNQTTSLTLEESSRQPYL